MATIRSGSDRAAATVTKREPRRPQHGGTPARRDRVGEEQDVDQTPTVLLQVGGRWRSVGGDVGSDHQAFASGFDEAPEGSEARVTPTVLVRGHDRLRSPRTAGERGLGQASATTHAPEQLRRFHGASISFCLCRVQPSARRSERSHARSRWPRTVPIGAARAIDRAAEGLSTCSNDGSAPGRVDRSAIAGVTNGAWRAGRAGSS